MWTVRQKTNLRQRKNNVLHVSAVLLLSWARMLVYVWLYSIYYFLSHFLKVYHRPAPEISLQSPHASLFQTKT